MNVIAFSLWGTDRRYVYGALANIELARKHYPGWICRVYCSPEITLSDRELLFEAGFQVATRTPKHGPHDGLFWRFEPAYEIGVDYFLSRDCDSRINPREAAAVAAWMFSLKRVHTMRDHYQHIVPILGGMWGCKHWPEFRAMLDQWPKKGQMGSDQDFLKEIIWPKVKHGDAVAHDLYVVDTNINTPNGDFVYKPCEFFGGDGLRPFPPHDPLIPMIHGEHVGARVWE
jgi:hypothetical protein